MNERLEITHTPVSGEASATTRIRVNPELPPTWDEVMTALEIGDTLPAPGDRIEVRRIEHAHTADPAARIAVFIAHRGRIVLDREGALPARALGADDDPLAAAAALTRSILDTEDQTVLHLESAVRETATGTLLLSYVGHLADDERSPVHSRPPTDADPPQVHAAIERERRAHP